MDLGEQRNQDEQYTSIQDLNMDLCFELIFPYLDVSDLVNVADSSKQMKEVAELTFFRKYRKLIIEVCMRMEKDIPKYEIDARDDYLILWDLKTCFGVLRCFGTLISKLSLNYFYKFTSDRIQHSRLSQYVMAYCVNNVTELEIFNNEQELSSLQKPFANVETVRLVDCILDGSSMRLNEWFPKMRNLEFVKGRGHFWKWDTKTDDPSFIIAHFPNLEHFGVYVVNNENVGFHEDIVLATLRLNPQIRSLSLHLHSVLDLDACIWPKLFREISESCDHLENLKIVGTFGKEDDDLIHFKNLKSLHISSIHPLRMIPFICDKLEYFCINSGIYNQILKFLQNNPSISKLKILGCLYLDKSVKA